MNKAALHREKMEQVLQNSTFAHQRIAAEKVQQQFASGHNAVILTAEMQSGKSGIALALACLQRLRLDDAAICDRTQLKDTLFLVTMADVALQEQAAEDLSVCPNVVVSNLTHFKFAVQQHFNGKPPKLLIIDECHYGTASDAVRYSQLFDYIENETTDTRIVLISATPFSALFAAGSESILRASFNTALVFHKTPAEYHGVRQMHKEQQIVELLEDHRDFTEKTIPRNLFLHRLHQHQGAGWALIRVGNNNAKRAKDILLAEGFSKDQIFIVGQKLSGLEEHELVSLSEFKRHYQNAALFDEKIIAITVASFRAGINFGQEMKEGLIATWDSTVSNIAAVVQANIGRASGFHKNHHAKHFTNLRAVAAYTEFLNHLEQIDSTSNFESIHALFDTICDKYQVNGFDRGISLYAQKQQIEQKADIEHIAPFEHFECIDLELTDYWNHTTNENYPELKLAIEIIEQYLETKPGIAVRQESEIQNLPNWLSVRFVHGQNFEPIGNDIGLKDIVLEAIQLIKTGTKCPTDVLKCMDTHKVVAFVFDSLNLAENRDAMVRRVPSDDIADFTKHLGLYSSHRAIILFARGHSSQDASITKYSRIRENSIFNE